MDKRAAGQPAGTPQQDVDDLIFPDRAEAPVSQR